MARTDSLTNFCTDVATAIKNKKGDDTPIKASEFDIEIENLPSGGEDISEYFNDKISAGTSTNNAGWLKIIKKILTIKKVEGTSLQYAFSNYPFEEIDLSELDTSQVTNMAYMFSYSNNLKKIIFGNNFDTSKTGDMSLMFSGCSSLQSLDLSSFNTQSLTNIPNMFANCSGMTSLNISSFDLSKVTTIIYCFTNCNNLENLKFGINLGKGYSILSNENYSNYVLSLSKSSNLTHESLMSVINNVYDIASIGVKPQQIQLGATNLAKLSEEEIAIATEKGWNVTA